MPCRIQINRKIRGKLKIYEFSLNLRIHWLLKTSNEIQLAKQKVELGQCLYLHKFKMEPFYGNKITH